MTDSIHKNEQAELSFTQLQDNALAQQSVKLTDLFQQDAQRFDHFSVHFNPLSFDYSKHRITQACISGLGCSTPNTLNIPLRHQS